MYRVEEVRTGHKIKYVHCCISFPKNLGCEAGKHNLQYLFKDLSPS